MNASKIILWIASLAVGIVLAVMFLVVVPLFARQAQMKAQRQAVQKATQQIAQDTAGKVGQDAMKEFLKTDAGREFIGRAVTQATSPPTTRAANSGQGPGER